MKIKINFNKKTAMIAFGIIFLLAGSLVYAYGTSNPAVFGHSSGEVSLSGIGLQTTFVSGSSGLACPSGYELTGCGSSDSLTSSAYASTDGKCYGSGKIYAICTKLG